jgi:hypothetical protein
MKPKDHFIQKQILDFEFPTKNSAVQWQRNVSFRYQHEFATMISSILDEYEDGSYQYIEKLEIQLGRVREIDIASALRKALDKALQKSIERSLPETDSEARFEDFEKGTITTGKGEKELLLLLFDHFLNYGILPWKAPNISVAVLEAQLSQHFATRSLTSFIITNQIFERSRTKKRLYLQFSKTFANSILREYFQADINLLLIVDKAIQGMLSRDPMLPNAEPNLQNDEDEAILRWIALDAPVNTANWPIEFIKWTLENQGSKKSQGAVVKNWQQLKQINFQGKKDREIALVLRSMLLAPGTRKIDGNIRRENEEGPHADLKESVIESKKDAKKKDLEDKNAIAEFSDPPNEEKSIKQGDSAKVKNGKEIGKSHKKPVSDQTGADTGQVFNEKSPSDIQLPEETTIDPKIDATGDLAKEPKRNDLVETISNESKASKHKDNTSEEETGNVILRPEQDNEASGIVGRADRETDNPSQEDSVEIQAEEQEILSSSEGCYVTLGGLILIWPYLSRMFRNLDYTQDDKFVSKDKRERAVLLLGYIGTGNAVNEEPHLILPKFLCGWPIQMPVIKDAELKMEEMNEANAMLKNLIQNWKILKNTSIEGLRETFFEREGKLADEQDHWKLTVEQKGTDILLDHLPYGRSIIKLPWLRKLLKVDWA